MIYQGYVVALYILQFSSEGTQILVRPEEQVGVRAGKSNLSYHKVA